MNTQPQVSFFRKLYLPASDPRSLEEIIILIRTRRWTHEILAYRNAVKDGDKEKARELKTGCPVSPLRGCSAEGIKRHRS